MPETQPSTFSFAKAYLRRSLLGDRNGKYIYLTNHKVASATIKGSLWQSAVNQKVWDFERPAAPNKQAENAPYSNELAYVRDLISSDVYTFGFVRNPYYRVLSAYLHQIRPQKGSYRHLVKLTGEDRAYTFSEFVKILHDLPLNKMDHHWLPQSQAILINYINIDFVGRLENFGEDFQIVMHKLFGEHYELWTDKSKKATGAKESASDFFTDDLVDLIKAKYAEDFAHFGYDEDWEIIPSKGPSAFPNRMNTTLLDRIDKIVSRQSSKKSNARA